jgi:hypothetical protein
MLNHNSAHSAECHYDECRYAECRGALSAAMFFEFYGICCQKKKKNSKLFFVKMTRTEMTGE